MNCSRLVFIVLFFCGYSVISQNKNIIHSIEKGETISSIARKYNVSMAAIYQLNPEAKKTLHLNQKLQIPIADSTKLNNGFVDSKKKNTEILTNKEEKTAPTEEGIVYEVLPKETKYSISKAYGVSIDRLEKANPILQTEELKIGQKIIIPVKSYDPNAVVENVKKEDPDSVQGSLDQGIQHEVLAKETKYGIAREYGITVKELESQNPKITKGLLIGSILTIRGSRKEVETVAQQTVLEPVIEEKEAVTLGKDEDEDLLDKLVSTASDNIGVRYRSGGTTKNGFDCSGLMCATFGTYDIKLPRTSIEQSQYGYVVDNERAKKGDLIFFKTNGRSRINHVGMVIEVLEGEIKFIHAATHGGVTISSTKESYYAKRMAQINRVLN